MPPREELTHPSIQSRNGNRAAKDQRIALKHDKLRRPARHYMRRERSTQILQPTALLNQALYLYPVRDRDVDWQSGSHCFEVLARLGIRGPFVDETIAVLGISVRTVKSDWRFVGRCSRNCAT